MGKKADVAVCIIRANTSILISLADVIADIVNRQQTTRPPDQFQGTWDIGKPYDTGAQICAHVGCTVAVGNCSGTATIRAVERTLNRLEKINPGQIPDIKQIASPSQHPLH